MSLSRVFQYLRQRTLSVIKLLTRPNKHKYLNMSEPLHRRRKHESLDRHLRVSLRHYTYANVCISSLLAILIVVARPFAFRLLL